MQERLPDPRAERRPSTALAFLLTLCAAFGCALPSAASEAPGQLDLNTERVVVFKDGYGLFVKEARGVVDEEGRAWISQVPEAAVLGSFWALAPDDRPLLSMTAAWVETVETRETRTSCTTIPELLRVNVGKRLRLELGDDRVVEGRLREVLDRPFRKEDEGLESLSSSSYLSSAFRILPEPPSNSDLPRESVRELVPRGGDLFVLETEGDQRLILPVAAVRSVAGPMLSTAMIRREEVTRRNKRLIFDLGEGTSGREVTLRLLYFSPGIRWIPTYRLEGALVETAELSLQGEILNEAEDVEEARIDLVVGVPNFRFKEVVSPFVLESTLRRALRQAAPNLMNQSMSNALFTQRASEWRPSDAPQASEAGVMDLAPELATGSSRDLFVYSRPALSLARGTRAAVALWRQEIELEHLHTFDLALLRDGRTGGWRQRGAREAGDGSPLRLSQNRVWHQMKLINRSEVPWTTGAALVLRDTLPLGQELLTYTSPGGETLLPITVAVNLRADHDERETGREPGALQWDGHPWVRVRKRGTITLRNYEKEAVTLRVTASFGGKAESATEGGRITINDFRAVDWENGSTPLNNHSDVRWDLELGAGESRTLSYELFFYVR